MNFDRFNEGPHSLKLDIDCEWCECGEPAFERRDDEPMCEDCAEKFDNLEENE